MGNHFYNQNSNLFTLKTLLIQIKVLIALNCKL